MSPAYPLNLVCSFGYPLEAIGALREERRHGINVAVVDSGIECGHPDLGGLSLRDDIHIVQGDLQNFAVQGDSSDLNGHGTAIASIIRRMAPAAQIGSFRVLDAATISKSDIIREGA
jgi:subtilisin family serine protease